MIEIHRSAAEIHRYRMIKAGGAALLLVGASAKAIVDRPGAVATKGSASVSSRAGTPRKTVRPEPYREDYKLALVMETGSRSLPIGPYVMEGTGPRGATARLLEADEEILSTPVGNNGRWRAAFKATRAGLKTFQAEFLRDEKVVGKSKSLILTFTGGKAITPADLRVSNIGANNRLPLAAMTLRGYAPPGDFVQVYVDATLLGRADVNLDGRWEFKIKLNKPGRRTFTVIDGVTQHQFGPLPVVFYGKAPAKPFKKKPPASN